MDKRKLNSGFVLLILFLFIPLTLTAQERGNEETRVSPNATVSQTIGTTVVTITYGRPSVNEREVFGGLEPFGEVWRAGANEATTITFSDDVEVEGQKLSAGTYGLFMIPREDEEWTVIFNDVPNQWGAYNYNPEEDALRIDVPTEDGVPIEQLMYYFENIEEDSGDVILHWSTVKVPVSIEV